MMSKEANPSEALREFNIIRHLEIGFDKNGKPITLNDIEGLNIIKQALLKAQEQEKVLEIIKKKPIESGIAINYYIKQQLKNNIVVDYKQYKKNYF